MESTGFSLRGIGCADRGLDDSATDAAAAASNGSGETAETQRSAAELASTDKGPAKDLDALVDDSAEIERELGRLLFEVVVGDQVNPRVERYTNREKMKFTIRYKA